MGKPKLFQNECRDETVIVIPTADLSEFQYENLEAEAEEVLALLDRPEYRNVVVDMHQTDYCGSSALGLFLKIWKKTRASEGAMAFCGLSDHEREIFHTMRLDTLWPICDSREGAFEKVNQ